MLLLGVLTHIIIFLSGCSPQSSGNAQLATTHPQIKTPEPFCAITPIIVPTLPDSIPAYGVLDKSAGLHITGSAQTIDPVSYRLIISGLVEHPLSLTYDDLRCMEKITATPRLVCPGEFEDTATWSGVALKMLLEQAGVEETAKEIILISADGYKTTVSLEDALKEDNFLAYELNGQPIPVLHGFPVRAVFPALDGYDWVKWLVEIRVE